jgi:hypothetical protein
VIFIISFAFGQLKQYKMEIAKTKTSRVNAKSTRVRKSRFAEYWEKYPNGCGEIMDYRAVLK